MSVDTLPAYLRSGSKTYEQVHSGLHWAFGTADQFDCVGGCGRSGKHWAYQYSAVDSELVSPTGARYSEDFRHYAPMCVSCHRSYDIKQDPARLLAETFQPGGQRAIKALLENDPSWVRYRAENMRTLNAARRVCVECSLATNPGALAVHQRATGHKGIL